MPQIEKTALEFVVDPERASALYSDWTLGDGRKGSDLSKQELLDDADDLLQLAYAILCDAEKR